MASKNSTTIPHTLIKALGQAIGTYGFPEEDAVLRQFAATCAPSLRKRLLSFAAACHRCHVMALGFRGA